MRVTLRKRNTGKKISLYLDYYHSGERRYQFLSIYLYKELPGKPLTALQRKHNKEAMQLAESIRSKKHLDMQAGDWGFDYMDTADTSLFTYIKQHIKTRTSSISNKANWESMLLHLKAYCNNKDITFEYITPKWLDGFKEFLQQRCKKKNGEPLAANTIVSYFSKLSSIMKQALKDGIIAKNPMVRVDNPKAKETKREFLTIEELKKLSVTACECPILKKAFLFSALTGLRHSDIKQLTWSQIQHSEGIGYFIRFTQQKTKGEEVLPISEEAYSLLGETSEPSDLVFTGLQYSAWYNLKLRAWMLDAGITKKISFHCARHTFATLQLAHGTDIFTVSKLLGHKNLKTTQVYAKVMDSTKVEAMNRIQIGL